MSTYWYYECLTHDPAIRSDEFTQHTDDQYYRHGVELALSRPLPEREDDFTYDDRSLDYYDRNARRFLTAHPRCRLQMVSEYGEAEALPVVTETDPRLANDWKLKCPSCGSLIYEVTPYKTITPLTRPHGEIRSDEPIPEWLEAAPIAGHQYRCKCGCTVDILAPTPEVEP